MFRRADLNDLSALAEAAPEGGVVLLPETVGEAKVRLAVAILKEAGSGARLDALIESVARLSGLDESAGASQRLAFLLSGAVDPSADLECAAESDVMRQAAERIIAADEASPNWLAVIDKRLIECPVVRAMQRRLALAVAAED